MKYNICPKYILVSQVANSLNEDLLTCNDWTSNLINDDLLISAEIKTNQDMVLCGIEWVNQAFYLCDKDIKIIWHAKDGDFVSANTTLAVVKGKAKYIFTAERAALNFLQFLSGTATNTYHYVAKVKNLPVKIMDTRKTIPLMRLAQKYAVCVGGGYNQRLGLYDGVLIKENHIIACGGIRTALNKAMEITPKHIPIQIEVETVLQLKQAINGKAKLILLDNMSIEEIKLCVEYNESRAILEASGDINLDNIYDYALTGVDRISIGALTKNINSIDLSLRMINDV